MKIISNPAIYFAFFLFVSVAALSQTACAEEDVVGRAEIQSSCSTQGGLYGTDEEMYCLNYFGARRGYLAHSLMPSLCLACTLICDEEDLDYARCRERCARACGLENGEPSAVVRAQPRPLALAGSR